MRKDLVDFRSQIWQRSYEITVKYVKLISAFHGFLISTSSDFSTSASQPLILTDQQSDDHGTKYYRNAKKKYQQLPHKPIQSTTTLTIP